MADKDLADMPVTHYLTIHSNAYYRLLAGSFIPDTPGGASSATIALDPRSKALPGANISLASGGGQSPTATVSAGGKLLNYQGRFEKTPGGGTVTNTVSGKAGPVGAHFSKIKQSGSRETGFGANLNIGPVQLSALRNLLSRDAVDPRLASDFLNPRHDTQTDTFGARGSLPLGPGRLSGNVNRQFVEEQGPQHISQESRPTGKRHVTNYGLGWKSDEGKVGPGIFNVQGNLTDPRGGKPQSTAGASYYINRPFGLPASVGADISSVNPLDHERRQFEAWLRLKKPF